ncbi:multidrug ABC transporter ATP-binding protein [Rhizobium sp. Root274]|uniref:ABC transporter ATP-binding protein n=1 Tax=unclassified Rhizobium TaxID=2613769 RepID=UPI00071489C7|nr:MULTISPECIES: ABC transporter ATP-binding protein [unclassified Rhizobium]KQW29045.1 multidrug ABC transporter ATP-binding protein [Rhizobium sp. Root1240]KRD29241.1 multidrug ABC transporter ATP-binding protein [Rhizobium sp. Root274]
MLRFFETIIVPTARETPGNPPEGLLRFYWFFVRQAKGLFIALIFASLFVALADAAIPVFMGKLVKVLTASRPDQVFADGASLIFGLILLVLVIRPLVTALQGLVLNQAIAPGVTNMVRWQSHWHVIRQNLSFFQNDFAGRIGSRVLEIGHTLRSSVVSVISVVWYLVALGLITSGILAAASWWLVLPVALWTLAYIGFLIAIVPQIRRGSKAIAYARSDFVGRIVDSYTNIMTVKLFARPEEEDQFVREAVDQHTSRMITQHRWLSLFSLGLTLLSGLLIASTTWVAIKLWANGAIGIDIVAMVLPMTLQISGTSARVAQEITQISDQVGTVHEAMDTIAKPIGLTDPLSAKPLQVTKGAIRFDKVSFHYGRKGGIIEDFSLDIRPGERIGLVGRSGAGKSTLVNLLLRFYDVETGRITIDGQDVAEATQASIRQHISVVTQDTSLLHRSIHENIAYGRRSATRAEVIEAARQAHAVEFIEQLSDWHGRTGFDAHVGERGVKLSGGQRQRIAIARVILKNAPILILDEATSALDSEVEQAIQASLEDLMQDRTVIAIAHRLSTIAAMDRLVILDKGRIVEQGTHGELLAFGGHYAGLWARQSGGFLEAEG